MRVHGAAGDAGRRDVHLVDERHEVVVGHRDAVRVERVRLDDVGAGLEVLAVDVLDDPGLRQHEKVVRALEVRRMIREALPAVSRFVQAVRLDHRPHRAVDHEDPLGEELPQAGFGRHVRFASIPTSARIRFTTS